MKKVGKIIKVRGGLGNQMFQYALYLDMLSKGLNAKLDFSWFDFPIYGPHLQYHLDIFGIQKEKLELECTLPRYIVNEQSVLNKLERRLEKSFWRYFEKEPSVYDVQVYDTRKKYLEGYWQSPKYFESNEEVVRKAFIYKGDWDESNLRYRKSIENSNSVCIHIRGGDYLAVSSEYVGMCDRNYYLNAIQYMQKQVANPCFFVFTDDIRYAKSILGNCSNVVYVEGNKIEHSYMDMILMSYAKHYIISNSSFSWWGAWLGKSNEKIVIAPKKWLNNYPCTDVWGDNWIKM